MNSDWHKSLEEVLKKKVDLKEIFQILKKIKDEGVDQELVIKYLTDKRSNVDETTEDKILEILDIVTGYCKLEYRVWN